MADVIAPKLTEAQAGYLSGIVDGEGYIGLQKTSERQYLLRVVITSTSKELVTWIHKVTSLGKIVERDMSRRDRQTIYEWKVFGGQATVLLELVQPYLVIKTAQAIIALRYQHNQTLSGKERFEFARQCSESMKLLNSRQSWKQTVKVAAPEELD